MIHGIRKIVADDPTVIFCECGAAFTARTLALADAQYRQHMAVHQGDKHVILVRADNGDHWECICGRWRIDSPYYLTGGDEHNAMLEWVEHVEFEERYGPK